MTAPSNEITMADVGFTATPAEQQSNRCKYTRSIAAGVSLCLQIMVLCMGTTVAQFNEQLSEANAESVDIQHLIQNIEDQINNKH
jgi:hypothetical protein